MSLLGLLSGDTVTVTTYQGDSAYGPVYGTPTVVDCRVEADRKMVRNTAGDEVVSESTIYVLPTLPDGRRTVDVFAPESLVTHDGRESSVIACNSRRGMGPAVYVEVVTT